MTDAQFEEMKRYVRFGDDEALLVAAFGRVATPRFTEIVTRFYERIREHEEAHAVLTGEAQIERLQAAMHRWLSRLLGGRYDSAYFLESMKIGRAHVRVGLPPRYMFTAMTLIRGALLDVVDREMGERAPRVRSALLALLDIELGVMLESYRENFVARIQQVERLEKEALGRSLARAEHRYKSAVELARVMIIGLDGGLRIQLFNREAERVSGFARDEAIGQRFVDLLIPEESRAVDGALIARALSDADPKGEGFDGCLRSRAGNVRIVRWHLAFSPSDTTDEVVLFAVGQDRTDEVALAERTRQHEKLAAVGTLAAGLAHEIRNPLNGAQLHVSYLERSLRRTGERPELMEAVSVVGDEIKRLATLVTEFLEFARPQPMTRRPISVRALSDRALQLVQAPSAAANVTLRSDLPTEDETMQGDADRLQQVLLNLLNNAVEALIDGHGTTVWLRVRRRPRHIVFEVEDDGPGIVRPDAPIFDAFFSTKPSGTGLGLAITHRIVTDHGGTVDVESRPGRTTFRVILPVEGPSTRAVGITGGES